MKYQLIILKKAQKDLKKVDPRYRSRIIAAFIVIRQDPLCGKPLEGEWRGTWSYRVWPYRILYEIHADQLLVHVVKIGHRQGVY